MRRFTDGQDGANRRTLSIEVWARTAFCLGVAILLVVAGSVTARPAFAQTTEHPGLQRAVDAYRAGDLALTLAILDELPVSLPARDQAFRNLYRGLVHFATGDVDDARAAFARAVQFEPAVQLDPAVHAPSRVEAYTQVRDSMVAMWRSEARRAESAGDLEQARRAWSLVASATPSDAEAQQRLAAIRRQIAQSVRGEGDEPDETSTQAEDSIAAAAAAARQDSVRTAAARQDSVPVATARTDPDTVAAGAASTSRSPAAADVARFDAGQALALGLVTPGLGHFYTQRPVRGLLVLGAAAGALAAGVFYEEVKVQCLSIPTANVCPPSDIVSEEKTRPYLLPAIGVAAAITVIGAIDAFAGARSAARDASTGVGGGGRPPSRSGLHLEPPAIGADGSNVQLAIVRLRF